MSARTRVYDAVVVGAGTAGLVAGTRLAQAGARVCVVARGHGSTQLAPGTVDEPLEPEVVSWLLATVAAGPFRGYEYVGCDSRREFVLPTAMGMRKAVRLAPASIAAGDLSAGRSLVVVGSRELRDFHAGLCAANLSAAGVEAHAVEFRWGLDRADASPLQVARSFDDPAWRQRFCERLAALLNPGDELVGLPAVLGARYPRAVQIDLERRLGRPVFEIPTLPPSVPGLRLFQILTAALRDAGGQIVIGPTMSAQTRDRHGRLVSITTDSAGARTNYTAERFVFATGEAGLSEGAAITTGYRALEVAHG